MIRGKTPCHPSVRNHKLGTDSEPHGFGTEFGCIDDNNVAPTQFSYIFKTNLLHNVVEMSMSTIFACNLLTNAPRCWATLSGTASDGRPAFALSSDQTSQGIKKLQCLDMYVLGRVGSKTGYYHIETREAHTILLMRVNDHISAIQTDVGMAGCCFGSSALSKCERKLVTLRKAKALLEERLSAAAPSGTTKTKQFAPVLLQERKSAAAPTCTMKKKQVAVSAVYSRDGTAWVYPNAFYDTAGGACHGAVVSSGGGTFLLQEWRQRCSLYRFP
jgi:hypothetical protein